MKINKERNEKIYNMIKVEKASIEEVSEKFNVNKNQIRNIVSELDNIKKFDNIALEKNLIIINHSMEELDDISLSRFNLTRITPHKNTLFQLYKCDINTLGKIKKAMEDKSLYDILSYNQLVHLKEMLQSRLNVDLDFPLEENNIVRILEREQHSEDVIEFYIQYRFNNYMVMVRRYEDKLENENCFIFFWSNSPNKSDMDTIERYLMCYLNQNVYKK